MRVVDAFTKRLRTALPAWAALLVIVGAVVIVLDDDAPAEPGPGEARLEVAEGGEATVTRAGGDVEQVDGETLLRPGDRVEMADGTGSLRFQDDVVMEIRAARPSYDGVASPASSVVVGELPTLRGGDVLLVSGGSPAQIEADGTEFTVDGAAKVTKGLGVRVASYEGEVDVDSAGQLRAVPALRQLNVPALGRPTAQPRALAYDATDEWDRRHLREAIEFGDELEQFAIGITTKADVPAAKDAVFVRRVVPGLREQERVDRLLDTERRRSIGELLIGAVIAEESQAGEFDDRWEAVFGFRDLGAHWGLVALDQQVDTLPLLDLIGDAIADSPLDFGGGDGDVALGPTNDGPGNGGNGPGNGPGGSDVTDVPTGDDPTDPGGTLVDGPTNPDDPTATTSPPGTSPPGIVTTTTPPTTPPTVPTTPPPSLTLPPTTTTTLLPTTLPPITTLPTVTVPPVTTLPTIPLPTVPDGDDDLVGEILDPVEDTADDLVGGLLG